VAPILGAVLLLASCAGDEDATTRTGDPHGSGADASPSALVAPARDDSPVQTDALEYTLACPGCGDEVERIWTEVPGGAKVVYVNRGDSTTYVAQCCGWEHVPIYSILRWPDRGGSDVNPGWGCCGGNDPIAIAPGESYVFDVHLGNYSVPSSMSDRTGLFRIELMVEENDSYDSPLVPLEQRQSNVFQIHPPQ